MENKKRKILTQDELKQIFEASKEKNWQVIQDNQINLKTTLVNGYKENWKKFQKAHPDIKPIFDMKNTSRQDFRVTKDIADQYNLLGHLKEFDKKSDNSTAGIRAFYDILHSENPSMMYNDLFLALLVDAEAIFLTEVHKEIKTRLEAIEKDDPGFKKHLELLREKMGETTIKVIEEIYGLPIEEILPFCRDNIVKLVGGEVRAHTAKFVEMESRILAEKGIIVITAPNYGDSIPIYMHSFLSFVLGVTGVTNYTPSHSSNYLFGRKVLAIGGGQLLPDAYENYRRILRNIIEEQIAKGDGYNLIVSSSNNSNIKKNLSYDRMVKLYAPVLNITDDDVKNINQATLEGHKITLNCLNGSTWKTLSPLLKELGIDEKVFNLVYENEDPFFDIGYVVNKEDEGGLVRYSIDHLGTDVSMKKVGTTIPYSEILKEQKVGSKVYECDADSDRYCVKQLVENNARNLELIKTFGLDNYMLDDGKILVALSPNKMFLMLDVADYERMKSQGTWDDYFSLYLITYVSSRAWAEFGDVVSGMKKVLTRVGFKNLTEMQQLVEKWYFNNSGEKNLEFKDQTGNLVQLDRSRKIRVHSKQEESGGRVAGMSKDCYSILGNKTLAMPEKSAPDSLISELVLSSTIYLKNNRKLSGEYLLTEMMDRVFSQYKLQSKIDSRIDILHGDQGSIALLPYDDQQKALEKAGEFKTNFNNFFFSLGKAVRDGELSTKQVGEIMKKVMPAFKSTWDCIDSMTLCEEPLSGGRTRPEGVPLTFKAKDGIKPLVTELDFRPSGTDPLKSKVYIDAEELSSKDRELIEEEFSNLTGYNLYPVLEHFAVETISKPGEAVKYLKNFNL